MDLTLTEAENSFISPPSPIGINKNIQT